MPLSFDPDWRFATTQGPATSAAVPMPDGVNGDRIDVWFTITGGTSGAFITAPSGWTTVFFAGARERFFGFRRIRDGTEGATETFTFDQSSGYGYIAVNTPHDHYLGTQALAVGLARVASYTSPSIDVDGLALVVVRQNDPATPVSIDIEADGNDPGSDAGPISVRTLDVPISPPSAGDYLHLALFELNEPVVFTVGSAEIIDVAVYTSNRPPAVWRVGSIGF